MFFSPMDHPANLLAMLPGYVEFNGTPVKRDAGLSQLTGAFTGKPAAGTQPKPSESWQRQMPTDTAQLLRQLSANAGEMGMPGGLVGGVQVPAYRMDGPQLPAINNPDMRTYGRTPGYGEATFYRQSMNGGMAPIAAMSPLGVPENWKPSSAAPTPTAPTASTAPRPPTSTPSLAKAQSPRQPKVRPTSVTPPRVPRAPVRPPTQQALAPDARQQLIDYLNLIMR